MVGIVSYGAYVPWYRLGPGSVGWTAKGEKAVANCDEDSITMSVAAARNCLGDSSRKDIVALYFASTTAPYIEKSNASVVAVASDLASDIFTADFGSSLKSGTSALKAALDAARASNKQALVTAADMRTAQPRSSMDETFGDGAAAILVGSSNVIAECEDSCSVSHEMLDIWRDAGDKFERSWEDRFVIEEGYQKSLPLAISTLLKKHNLTPKDFNKVVFYAPEARRHTEMAKKLGLDPKTQVQDPMLNLVGNTGAASALMTLTAALEDAKPGDRILFAGYGDGADAFMFKVTKEIETARKPGKTMKDYLKSKKMLPDYETYMVWRGLISRAAPSRRPPFRTPSPSAMLREVDKNLRFQGTKCGACGYPQYPPQTVCTKCQAKGQGQPYSFADKKATVFTYTLDTMAPTLDPPMVVTAINFEGGGRAFTTMTDRDTKDIKVGMPVEMTFRQFYVSEGIHNYIWRCMPVR
ncbi:MAG: hydroxymethylglutaryl-CoA synthase [Dehalococcoidia bacterium]|nr:hydroxymethylglutaryl-CoA synthase [Dehalococcoidia bacterium]